MRDDPHGRSGHKVQNALRGVCARCDDKARLAKQTAMTLPPAVNALPAWRWIALDALATLLDSFLATIAVGVISQGNLWALGVKVVGGEVM